MNSVRLGNGEHTCTHGGHIYIYKVGIISIIHSSFFFFLRLLIYFEREAGRGGVEREGERGSHAGSVL